MNLVTWDRTVLGEVSAGMQTEFSQMNDDLRKLFDNMITGMTNTVSICWSGMG